MPFLSPGPLPARVAPAAWKVPRKRRLSGDLEKTEGKLRAALRPADPSGPASPRRRALRLRMRLASCEDAKAGCRRASRSTTGPDQCFAPLGEVGALAAPIGHDRPGIRARRQIRKKPETGRGT